jgi:NADH-quinone oxidoreductase subunit L
LSRSAVGGAIGRFWLGGWGFDWLYERLFVRPFVWVARVNKADFIDFFYTGLARVSAAGHALLSLTETGYVRWYAAGLAAGAIIVLAVMLAARWSNGVFS